MSGYLAAVSVGTLCFAGIAVLLKWERLLALVAGPLFLICSLLVGVYTFWALRLGVISTVGTRGRIDSFSRKKEPIFFFTLVIVYFLLSASMALYMIYSLFLQ